MFHLGWFLSYKPQAWDDAHSDRGNQFPDPEPYVDFARTLERAGFDYLMIEDGSFIPDAFGSSMEYSLATSFGAPKLDPMALIPMLAAATDRIGLIGTITTSFYPPFLAARLMTTLDHLSRGRVGFNLVTAHNDRTAQNYGLERHYEHDERYRMAAEWMDLVEKLLTSWDDGAVLDDVDGGRWADYTKIHGVEYEGEYFSAKGPLNMPPGPQRVPVICQAGGSPVGRDFAAGVADTIVAPSGTVDSMRDYRADVRRRALEQGRDPDDIRVLFLTDFTIGDTDDDARALLERKHATASQNIRKQLARMSFSSGIDFSQFDLDAPVPPIETNAARTSTSSWFAGQEDRTLRQIASNVPPGLEIVGSPRTAADQMAEIMEAVGGDGFLVGNEVSPRAVADIAGDLAPELRRRGLMRSEYTADTLRGNLRAF